MSDDDASSIKVLAWPEAVRRRPGMYVGDTSDHSGLHHLLWEVVGNTIDRHLARQATELRVDVAPGSWITVHDDGPGISVARAHPDEPIRVLEAVLTRMHHGPTYDAHVPHVHVASSLRGCGLAVVSALATRVEVETTRDGVRWAQAFERGVAASALRSLGATERAGTTVRFQPDPEIFGALEPDHAVIAQRLQELAWLNPLLRVFFQDRRLAGAGGPVGWVERATGGDAILACHRHVNDVLVDLAIGWRAAGASELHSYVNMHPTTGGTHVTGLWRGLAEGAKRLNAETTATAHVRELLEPGLVAVVHVGLFAPRFGNPTREQLLNPVAGTAVRRALEQVLPIALWCSPALRARIAPLLGITDVPDPLTKA